MYQEQGLDGSVCAPAGHALGPWTPHPVAVGRPTLGPSKLWGEGQRLALPGTHGATTSN